MTLGLGPATARQRALAARLRRLRAAADLGPDELAAAAGISSGCYRAVEAGRADTLTYLDVLALADALDVPPAALLADAPAPRRGSARPPRD
jgi:transcriptional regulator with XRE-family HTH domain